MIISAKYCNNVQIDTKRRTRIKIMLHQSFIYSIYSYLNVGTIRDNIHMIKH